MSLKSVVVAFFLVLAMAGSAVAQSEMVLIGTVADTTDAVLPGVTITARHVATGNTFVGVSDGSGSYRVVVTRTGAYTVTAQLDGFAPRSLDVEFLVGQRNTMNFRLQPGTVTESVTVTSEAPLLSMTQSDISGNVDARQMSELPLNGRNWMQLTLLVPGSRQNAVDDSPAGGTAGFGFQLNLDGQQVSFTQTVSSQAAPRFSRETIAEFQLVTNRFDATQGRSLGFQVNAVTKAGTNNYSGRFSGFFRSDKFQARDFITNTVLPYSNQQLTGAFGGPIRRDKVHFFGYWEGEREPQAMTFTSPYPQFNIAPVEFTKTQRHIGGRVDMQVGQTRHLMVRGNMWNEYIPNQVGSGGVAGATNHPSTLSDNKRKTRQIFGSFTQAANTTTNELKVGVTRTKYDQQLHTPSVTINLRGYNIGHPFFLPDGASQTTYSARDDYSILRGAHTLKFGAEWLQPVNSLYSYQNASGVLDATLGPVPANIQDLFPVYNDPSTWNVAALSPITRRYVQAFGNFEYSRTRPQFGAWVQEDWRTTDALTLNLGLRWDFQLDAYGNEIVYPPFKPKTSQDWLNFQPRLGFAYAVKPTTVLRGGWGLYFSGLTNLEVQNTLSAVNSVSVEVLNDGRPDFASNPFNGPPPTVEEARKRRYDPTSSIGIIGEEMHLPWAHQMTFGVQQQIGQTMSVEVDYVRTLTRDEPSRRNANLTYDPATGVNLPFTNISTRPYPDFGRVLMQFPDLDSNYNALQTGFDKRFSDEWQMSASYTLSRLTSCDPSPVNDAFPVAPDLGGECGVGLPVGANLSSGVPDQRHRAVVNGIWSLPYSFQLSGLYFFGSGQRFATTYGGDLRNTSGSAGGSRLRPNGSIVPRNNFVGKPIHRVDMRLLRTFSIGSFSADGIVEVFNLFNHRNFGSYVTDEANARYGQPVQNRNVAYLPRTMQLGFRVEF